MKSMTFQKRKRNSESKDSHKKKKRVKRSLVEEKAEVPKAEFLDVQKIREGMLLLGCIIEIRTDRLLMSLPGCLVGMVPITNVSNMYTEALKNGAESEKSEELTLEQLFDLGSTFPCKVIKVTRYDSKKPIIILSIDPQAVNNNLNMKSLYSGMVLYSAVGSVEDHGYLMDLGIKNTKGFIPFSDAVSDTLLNVGQVVPTYLKNVPSQTNEESVLSLVGLSFEDTFPEVSEEDNLKLSAILPGAHVSAFVTEITQQFVYLKCFNYNACCSSIYAKRNKKVKEGETVSGTVLYIHPVTNMIYIHLGSVPTPESFDSYFDLQKYDKIKNVKFIASHHNRLFFKHQNTTGYVKAGEVAGKTSLSYSSLIKNPLIPKARVVFLHYIDHLVQLTFKEAQIKMKIVKAEDVQVGDIYEATVKKHVGDGMFVSICPGLSGFIRHIFISDSYITMPEKLHPVGEKVNCRVLFIHPSLGLSLTSKESLMNLPENELLISHEQAVVGKSYKGVIVKKTDDFILVLFLNNIKGIVSPENIPETSVFYVGQTVSCVVMQCNPIKKKLSVSLNCEKHGLKNNKQDLKNNKHGPKSDKISLKNEKPQQPMHLSSDSEEDVGNIPSSKSTNAIDVSPPSLPQNLPKPEFKEGKAYKAFIKKITAHQLNVVVNGTTKGRIHITQAGCSEEGALPLKQFTVGQRIKVYVLKEYERRRKNFLVISHRNMTSALECSLTYPASIPTFDKKSTSNELVLGFIRKIYDSSVSVWLSPGQCGTLDYINIHKNPKVLRKPKKNFKVGQSITVSILSIQKKKTDNQETSSESADKLVKLYTPGISVPDIGQNIVGFVTIASPDRGLVLKLPYGYSGFVCLTDIQDVYTPLHREFEKLLKLKFILCHVLEVDSSKKTCILSLRKSRLYTKNIKSNENISPEITIETAEQGKSVTGYIKSMSDNSIIVNIGRNLYGKISLLKCTKYGCARCLKIAEVLKSSAVGNVIEVVIDGAVSGNTFLPLSVPCISNLACTENTSLQVKEDINWNEL